MNGPDGIKNGFRFLIESAPDGFFVHDVLGRILDVNERSCADLGYSREELLKLTINDISCMSSAEQNLAQWAEAPPGLAVTFREAAKRKDGSIFPVEISITCQVIDGRKLFLGLARDITERERAAEEIAKLNKNLERRVELRTRELREAQEKLQAVMDSAQDAIFFQDIAGCFQVLSRSAERLIGASQTQALGKTVVDLLGSDIGEPLRKEEDQVLATGRTRSSEKTLTLGKQQRTLLISRSAHRDRTGTIAGLVTVAHDITGIKQNEHRIRQEHDRLLLAARVGGLGIWDYDMLKDELYCDEQWYQIMGRDPLKPISSISEFRAFIHPDDVARATEVEQTAVRLSAGKEDYGIEFRIVRPDGAIRWVRSAAAMLDNLNGTSSRAIGFVIDITEAWLAEQQLKDRNVSLQKERANLLRLGEELGRQAMLDPLTGIANRRRMDQELEKACLNAMRLAQPISVAMIDVDFFKRYNDHYGHAEGDNVLKAVAGILASAALRPYDLAARYGGEEFVLLLPGVGHPEIVLDRIAEAVERIRIPHAKSPVALHLTLSCGCAVAMPPATFDPTELLAQSDRALYQAKAAGRNRYVVTRV